MNTIDEIVTYLESKGFVKQDNVFTRTQQQIVGQVIVNGKQTDQTKEVKVVFEYIGEGSIDDKPTYGYNLKSNDRDLGDIWVDDVQQFIETFKI